MPSSALSVTHITSKFKAALRPFENLAYNIWTLFLFVRSDCKTTLIPMGLLAICTGPNPPFTRLIPSMFWVFIHLLEFDLANQILNPAEDAQNKPYRPIPAGRCSLEAARSFRWGLFAFNTIWSAFCGPKVLGASIACSIVTRMYNDMGFDRGNWINRSFLIALVTFATGYGTCVVKGNNTNITREALLSITSSLGIFMTTAHAQDFKDVTGDELVDRHTFPLEYPTASRFVMFATVLWSVSLSLIWKLSLPAAAIFNFIGMAVALRFWAKRRIKADERSYYLYCCWITMALCLPGVHRLSALRVL